MATESKVADPRAVSIFAKSIYRELRSSGYSEGDVMALASELLELLATDVQSRQVEVTAS